jgi:hypothetical protein
LKNRLLVIFALPLGGLSPRQENYTRNPMRV